MWLVFLIGYFGMLAGNIGGGFFLKKDGEEIFTAAYFLTFGYGIAVGIYALN